MADDVFRPHGDFDAYIEGSILIARVSGSWNIQRHKDASVRSAPLTEKLDTAGKWGCIVIVEDTLVASLEVFEAGRKAVEDIKDSSSLSALSWVITPEIEGYSLLLPRYKKMYEGLIPSEVFQTLDQARTWTNQILCNF